MLAPRGTNEEVPWIILIYDFHQNSYVFCILFPPKLNRSLKHIGCQSMPHFPFSFTSHLLSRTSSSSSFPFSNRNTHVFIHIMIPHLIKSSHLNRKYVFHTHTYSYFIMLVRLICILLIHFSPTFPSFLFKLNSHVFVHTIIHLLIK